MRRESLLIVGTILMISIIISGCARNQKATTEPVTATATSRQIASPPTSTPRVIVKPDVQPTSTNSPTPFPTLPKTPLALIGTEMPAGQEVIDAGNINRLAEVARLGRGKIQAAAFSPDGSKLVVGSAYGLAVYGATNIQVEPQWIPLPEATNYRDLLFSTDGKYLTFAGYKEYDFYYETSTYHLITPPDDIAWEPPHIYKPVGNKVKMKSPNGALTIQWDSEYVREEDNPEYAIPILQVIDQQTKTEVYRLEDKAFFFLSSDVHEPEGCDITNTDVCGSSYEPRGYFPYEGSFSPSSDTFAIVYRISDSWDYEEFSLLRIYDAKTGEIINRIGSLKRPVLTYAYSPDGRQILVAYVDGSMELWDIHAKKAKAEAWHFNASILFAEYTLDGEYLLISRSDYLEVRLARTGELRSRYDAGAYVLSPVDPNIIALADSDNRIRIIELDTGRVVKRIEGHTKKVLAVAFSPDGSLIASAGQDCRIKLWDALTGKMLHLFQETIVNPYEGGLGAKELGYASHSSRIFIHELVFVDGTDQLIGFGSWSTLVNWNVNSGATNYVIYSAPTDSTYGFTMVNPHQPSSFQVDAAAGRFQLGWRKYDLSTGEMLEKVADHPTPFPGYTLEGAYSLGRDVFFSLGDVDHLDKISIINTATEKLETILKVIPPESEGFYPVGIVLSSDGKTLLIATSVGTINLYQVK